VGGTVDFVGAAAYEVQGVSQLNFTPVFPFLGGAEKSDLAILQIGQASQDIYVQ